MPDEAAYSYSLVELDRPAAKGDQVLSVRGFTLAAPQPIPESGQLTAVACAVVTIGNKFEQRIAALFAEKRPSLAVAMDGVGNKLLFAAVRRCWVMR